MCLLILIRRADPDYPILVASNRDEFRERKVAPPGLFVGEHRRMLSPRDRRGGGTWMAINQDRMFAGITNLAGYGGRFPATTRGELPHLALDAASLRAAITVVRERCEREEFNPFQLVLARGDDAVVLVHHEGEIEECAVTSPVLVLTNEHRLGELQLPGVDALLERGLPAEGILDGLKPLLCDQGETSGHRILKKGGDYGTVSSSLVAVPARDLLDLDWWYAAGEPDTVEYRNYGNLGKRV